VSPDHFKSLHGVLKNDRAALEDALWDACLARFPDSIRLSLSEVYSRWLDEVPNYGRLKDEFLGREGKLYREVADRVHAMHIHIEKRAQEHRLRVARNVAMALQYPVFVFYECGKREDGVYAWRGCRYGIEGSQYLSGFGRD
jgi:hypothetical protein